MKRFVFFFLFFFCAVLSLAAQKSSPSAHFQCGYDAHLHALRQSDPEYARQEVLIEAAYRNAMTTTRNRGGAAGGVITLPVVVHIIHDNGPENIPDAQVLKGLEHLNDAFRNRNYYNPATGVDTEIEFCLARRDTAGKASTGIVRYQNPMTDMSLGLGSPSQLATWDKESYINIILVRKACNGSGCNVAGYATDKGILMEARYFGADPVSSTVIVHEMGHHLGLLHTFFGGCKNDNCLNDGDKVCDTPPDNSAGPVPCAGAMNSCQTDANDASANNPFRTKALGGLGDQNDQHQNYMDYSIPNCYDRFTEGQKQRMLFWIKEIRSGLMRSRACFPPCPAPVLAQFGGWKDSVEAGSVLKLLNQSQSASTYRWYLDGVLVSTAASPNIVTGKPGQHILRLEAESPLPECETGLLEKTITVYCPVKADWNYVKNGNTLSLQNQSQKADSIAWILYDAKGKVLLQSEKPSLVFDATGISYLQVCLMAKNAHCESQQCRYIKLIAEGIEICDNGLDDDKDGLMDDFDPDCPCDTAHYQAYCAVDCEYVPDSFPGISLKVKWASEILFSTSLGVSPTNIVYGDINNDGIAEILTIKSLGDWMQNNVKNMVAFLDGQTGTVLSEFISTPSTDFNAISYIINSDVNKDGKAEIFFPIFNQVFCFNPDGALKWKSDLLKDGSGRLINTADFNGDGIPEIYAGTQIINALTGRLLTGGNAGEGCNKLAFMFPQCLVRHTIAADLLPTPGLELAAGNTVYQLNLNNLNGMVGNSMVPVTALGGVTDGFTSVGDINGDGQLDVVVVRDQTYPDGGGVWVWDPRTRAIIASAPAGNSGGVPFVGDVWGDCRPEIGMTFEKELRLYTYDGSTQLKLIYSLPTSDESGYTGITMFDFNQDGRQELVYRDETDLRIFEGGTGKTLASYPLKSRTIWEYPTIVDLDNDGQAEIIINGHQSTNPYDHRIYCFESGGAPWAPARAVWNQYGYHVTNINDDLTVPRQPQNQAQALPGHEDCKRPTCPSPYNAFLGQATYRTQQGCVQFPAVDLSVEVLGHECGTDSLVFYLIVRNHSSKAVGQNCVYLSCYTDDPNNFQPWTPDLALTTRCLPLSLSGKDSDTLRLALPRLVDLKKMYFVINDDGNGPSGYNHAVTGIVECDYKNNRASTPLDYALRTLDLGPDQKRCRHQPLVLHAGSGFVSYLWSDGTQDSVYTADRPGLHFVEATDGCHRIYRDTVLLGIDTTYDVHLGPDRTLCLGQPLQMTVSPDYDYLSWFPADRVSCSACPSPVIKSDSSFALILLAGKGGCFSLDTVNIHVGPSYLLEKQMFTCKINEVGSDTLRLQTAFGCDSLVVTKTALLPSYLFEKQALTCKISEVGTDTLHLKTAFGCDSLVVTKTALSPSYLFEKQAFTCKISEVGTDTLRLQTAFGCDSLVVTKTALSPSYLFEKQAFTCKISEVGTDTLRLQTAFGCDSLVVTKTALSPSYLFEKQAFTCKISEVGTDTLRLQTAFGCDSLLVTKTALSLSYLSEKQAFTCKISEVGTDTLRLQTAFGCDSLVVTKTALLPSYLFEKQAFTCKISEVGTDTLRLQTALGCDSLVVMKTMLLPSYLHEKQAFTCKIGEVGNDTLRLQTALGCDSLLVTKTMLLPSYLFEKQAFTCKISEVGTDTLRLQTALGCDSLVVTKTALSPSYLFEKQAFTCKISEVGNDTLRLQTAFGCDSLVVTKTALSPSYLFEKQTFTCKIGEVGNDTLRLQTALGCDSLVVTKTALSPSYLFEKQAFTCKVTEVGSDTLRLQTALGCDSLVVTKTALSPSYLFEKQAFTCIKSEAGHDTLRLKTALGCDSLVVTNTVLSPSYLFEKQAFTCIKSEAGHDTLRLKTIFGCDSLVVTTKKYAPSYLLEQQAFTCMPDEVGSDTLRFKTIFGCDSVVVKKTERSNACVELYIPNVFSPGQSVQNQRFVIYSNEQANIRISSLRIYDRWGSLVFEQYDFLSGDPNNGWDGRTRGREASEGVYVWVLEALLPDGSILRKRGDVTLLR